MINQTYKEKDLPLKEMEAIGLASNGKLNISAENLNALLSGNRTELVRLNNLSSEGVNIKELDAKLSLNPNAAGKLNLLLHPIYKSAQAPNVLDKTEIEDLKNGTVNNVLKEVGEGELKKTVFVEFDKETNEFIKVDSSKVIAPESVNDQLLTQAQKKRFKEGQEIELPDGTSLQATGKNNKALLSNRSMLILSVMLDGGLSYMILKGIKALEGKQQKLQYNKGYNDALEKVLKEQKQRNIPPNNNKNLVILKDFKEVLPAILTKDSIQTTVEKIDVENLKLEPKHLAVLKEVLNYDNLRDLSRTVDPKANLKLADELRLDSQTNKDPIQVESNIIQAKQLEHFATLAEVVAMIEAKKDMVLDYIQDGGQGFNDVDYLKDVVTGISSALSPQVKIEATKFVNDNQEEIEVGLEEQGEEKLQADNEIEQKNDVKIGVKR